MGRVSNPKTESSKQLVRERSQRKLVKDITHLVEQTAGEQTLCLTLVNKVVSNIALERALKVCLKNGTSFKSKLKVASSWSENEEVKES